MIIKIFIKRADEKDENGVIFPYEVLKNQVDQLIKSGKIYGCEYNPEAIHKRFLGDASHLIEDLWWDGEDKKDLWASIKILSSVYGDFLKGVLEKLSENIEKLSENNLAVDFVLVGYGSLKVDKDKYAVVVGDDFCLTGIDFMVRKAS